MKVSIAYRQRQEVKRVFEGPLEAQMAQVFLKRFESDTLMVALEYKEITQQRSYPANNTPALGPVMRQPCYDWTERTNRMNADEIPWTSEDDRHAKAVLAEVAILEIFPLSSGHLQASVLTNGKGLLSKPCANMEEAQAEALICLNTLLGLEN